MKIVINTCYGGFGLNMRAWLTYKDLGGLAESDSRIDRTCPILIGVIEEMGERANSTHSRLKIIDIPDDVDWTIEDYDGAEWIAERHRVWK